MNRTVGSVTLLLLLALAPRAHGQSIQNRAVEIVSPKPNEEVCLGGSLPIELIFRNLDTIPRTLMTRFEIKNVVTGIIVDSTIDTLRNVVPGALVDTILQPYVTIPNILAELGTFRACASVIALDTSGHAIVVWPFNDTVCTRLFGIRRTTQPYRDPSNNYSKMKPSGSDIPDQTLWVSLGATVVDGETETWDPPPPRSSLIDGAFGPDTLNSPVIRLDRRDELGNRYTGNGTGDTLTSFPINLKGQTDAILTFDFQRGGKQQYSYLWDADTMLGPEQTVLDKNRNVLRAGDSLILEFKDSTEPACNPSNDGWNRIAAIDGGRDFEFKKIWINLYAYASTLEYRMTGDTAITEIPYRNYIDSTFRFRLRLKANDNAIGAAPADDDDAWYIDNVTLMVPRLPEIEVMWCRVVTPYSKIPYSAAAALPVYVNVKNNSTDIAIPFPIKAQIVDKNENTVYSQSVNMGEMLAGTDSVVRMPDWNAQPAIFDSQPFTVNGLLDQPGYQGEYSILSTYSTFYLNCETTPGQPQEFAYDNAGLNPESGAGNNIPSITGQKNSGIGFSDTTGSYAVKFVLPKTDTLAGARIYFASGNQAGDTIRISLFRGDSISKIPLDTVVLPGIAATFTDVRQGGLFDQFWPYYFPKPIVLKPGIYWIAVSQLSVNSFEMGGDCSRGGGMIVVSDSSSPGIHPIYMSPYGTQWSQTENSGDVSSTFAVEVPAGSDHWQQWMPSKGWWPTNASGNAAQAISLNPQLTVPFIRGGSFTPMIRPMMVSPIIQRGGITNKLANATLGLFPNPARSSLHIASSDGPLTVSDPLGRACEVRRSGSTLDISPLPPGVYYLSDAKRRARFVKE